MSTIDRRKMILAAATQSFAQFGYKATTMELVAKIANVGKGTTYTFFRTKEELFDEILRKALQEMKEVCERAIKREDTFDQNLIRVLDALLEFRADHELFVKLAQEVRDIGTVQALEGIKRLENLVLEYMRQEIEAAIEKGEIKPCDSRVISFMLLKFYIALTTEWSQTHEPLNKEQIKQYMQLLLSEGLLAKPN
ncbi:MULTISPECIES: TetR/AcrR family transcriptional regulator [Paenibacillus]|uniref:TetR family transcriptional regulator n=1 Tax=Paenibacillus naphthalenovorans TaxID=162209 RepID=A0A0U2U8A9_9BACL|nr:MULTISPECIES: TetR/AcrR family transcriptional regulator [Paenibacillus]ALS22585.1 TetR family transcriptional regulator [Paenibacillus naphthalenovorans]NTZ16414.1 TetR/AcrR family transcriptional regulator [Paenibacillus sp. JMULE4]NTZ17800.1 TetR/AcrR family transcriptional regulator [Paenibacillus sp. JMULE4]GCL70381.1 TetR/AcrR family transcriptional regulator [Paenibacillus naphthalenovorans]